MTRATIRHPMNTDNFTQRVQKELRALARKEDELAKRIEAAQRERATIRSRVTELTKSFAVYQEMMRDMGSVDGEAIESPGQTTANLAPIPSTVPQRTNGTQTTALGTTAELAAAFMKAHGGRARIKDLLAELVRVGKLAGNEGDYGSVFGALKRNSDKFVKVGPGEFALVDSGMVSEGQH